MGLQIYANLDAVDLQFGRVQSTTDLRPKEFKQFPIADSTAIDLYLTGQNGLLNIQDYVEVQLGVGEKGARPFAGTWKMLVGAETPIAFDASATALETVISSDINPCAVLLLAPYVYKVKFDSVGLQTLPSVDATDLTPNSSANISTFVIGDATTREEWLIRVFQNPLALTNSWTNTSDGGLRGNLSLGTAGIYELLGSNSSVESTLELELKDANGNLTTVFQVPIRITNEVIGQGATGVAAFGSYATTVELDAVAATAAADTAAALETTIHNTDAVIICNQGDNIQDKWDEAAALTPNGNPLALNNQATLIVMGGTYADLDLSNINNVTYISIIGIGKVDLVVFAGGQNQSHYGDFKNFQCELFSLYQSTGTIENITVIPLGSDFEVVTNAGTIRNVSSPHVTINGNTGTIENVITTGQWYQDSNSGEIKNCSAAEMLEYSDNSGIIDNCHSTGTLIRAFCAHAGYSNSGTIKNCTAKSARSFGEQTATGVTENCTSELQGFGATSSQITSGGGAGTYKNCAAGVGSFFGINSDTTIIRTMLANYIDCTAEEQSFGHVNVLAAETVFSGTATNCTAGFRSFASVGTTGGAASISADAVIENCSAGNFSFGSETNSDNFGKVLRCRTTQLSNPFKASGTTGVVRLGLDGNYNVVNIPVTAWPT